MGRSEDLRKAVRGASFHVTAAAAPSTPSGSPSPAPRGRIFGYKPSTILAMMLRWISLEPP
jgi:hypothetical protein